MHCQNILKNKERNRNLIIYWFFSTGSAGLYGIPSLTLLDLATGVRQDIGAGLRKGAGMLDLTWIDDTKLLSCGYDSYARLWDMRSGTCVRKWEEPFNEAIYCMSTDNNMTLVRFFFLRIPSIVSFKISLSTKFSRLCWQ